MPVDSRVISAPVYGLTLYRVDYLQIFSLGTPDSFENWPRHSRSVNRGNERCFNQSSLTKAGRR